MHADDTAPMPDIFTAGEGQDARPIGWTDASSDTDPATAAPRPRIRWAGVVWGLALAVVAAFGIGGTGSQTAFDDLLASAAHLTPAVLIAVPALALGAAVLVTGVVGLLRRAQRARTASAHG